MIQSFLSYPKTTLDKTYTILYGVYMKRYQVYLNPHSVSILDEVEEETNISRSKMIRELVDRYAKNITKVFLNTKTLPKKKYLFDQLIGSIKLGTKKKTNYALKSDLEYIK